MWVVYDRATSWAKKSLTAVCSKGKYALSSHVGNSRPGGNAPSFPHVPLSLEPGEVAGDEVPAAERASEPNETRQHL